MAFFNFCPESQVPETVTPAAPEAVSMNGWTFTARPSVPYQRKFKVTLYGLTWYLVTASGAYDTLADPEHNAHLLELFYKEHQTWKEFSWQHPHLGVLTCRFAEKVDVPAGVPNSDGVIEKLEVTLIESNPGF